MVKINRVAILGARPVGAEIAACIAETTSRVRIAFAVACPEADLFRSIARTLQPAGP